MSARTAWSIACLFIVAVLVVALWPRQEDHTVTPADSGLQPTAVSALPAPAHSAAPGPVATPPCPTGTSAEAAGPLADVVVRCLGSDRPVDLGGALAGEPALLNLWASWCGPCREEMPVLDAYVREPGTVRVIGVNVQDTVASAASLMAELTHPEPGFYVAGMKSYGRAPTFLAMTGYEQVRSIAAALAGDHDAAARVELTLPETGVCGGAGVFDDPTADTADAGGCCGPAEPALVTLSARAGG